MTLIKSRVSFNDLDSFAIFTQCLDFGQHLRLCSEVLHMSRSREHIMLEHSQQGNIHKRRTNRAGIAIEILIKLAPCISY